MFFKEKKNLIRRSPDEIIFDALNTVMLFIFGAATLYPFWYVLILSLNEGRDAALGGIWFWPRKLTFSNFQLVLDNPMLKSSYFITVARTVSGSLLTLVVTTFAAYALSKKFLRGRSLLISYFMLPMFIGGTVVSNYIIIANLGLINNFLIYILPGCFNFFYMIIIRTFINDIPDSLEESAKLDGANYLKIMFRIVLPVCMPVIAAILLFTGVDHWLDFYTNLIYVQNENLYTVQYLLYLVVRANQPSILMEKTGSMTGNISMLQRKQVTSESIQMATLIVTTLPILFIYPFLQKYFIKGILIGAIKE